MKRTNLLPLAVVCLSSFLLATPGSADITEGLVGHWKLDDGMDDPNSTIAVDSVGDHHGTLLNGPVWTDSLLDYGGALSFDGGDDCVEIPHSDDLTFTASDSYTIAAWVNVVSLPGHWAGIANKSRDAGSWYGIWISSDNEWCAGTEPENTNGSGVTLGRHHLAIVQNNATGDRILYLDGQVDATGSAQDSTGAGDLWFGGAKSVSEYFEGVIDDVRIYDRPLSQGEIAELMSWTGAEVDAGRDQRIEGGHLVTLTGKGPEDTTSFSWEQIVEGDEPLVTLSDPDSAVCTFTPPIREIGYVLTFRLTVVSTELGTLSDETKVTVLAPNEPRLPPGNFRVYPANLGFRLEWDALVDANDYGVGFKIAENLYFWFWTFDTYYPLTNLTEGQATTVAVRARNSYGQGVRSEDITLIPMRNVALPASLQGMSPPSGYVYAVSHFIIADMNDKEIEDDNNDSWSGSLKTEDYWGYLWPSPLYFDHVAYHTGNMFWDGGWFLDLTVQYTEDGSTWIDLPTKISPEYDFTDQRAGKRAYARYDLSIPTVRGIGVRIYGAPGGIASFTSISELGVFGDEATPRPLVVQALDGEVPERDTASLDGSWSFSTRGSVSGFTWEQVSGPTVAINNATTAVTSFDAPGVEQDTVLVFKLTATDGTETLSDEDVRIMVRNLKTTAVAGPDQSVEEGSEASLNGIGSLTTSGNITYQWTQTVGSPVTLINPNAAVCTFTAPVIWDYTTELTFQLRVDDGLGQPDSVSTDEVGVEVRNSLCWPAYPLPEGYFQDVLHLGTYPTDRILGPLNIQSGADPLATFGGEANISPAPGEAYDFSDTAITVTRNPMVWTPIHSASGWFGNEGLDNFQQVYHIYILSPEKKDVRWHFRHDDEIRVWNNGNLIFSLNDWDYDLEATVDGYADSGTGLSEGLNSISLRFEEGNGGNYIAAGITDLSDLPFTDLYYSLGPSFFLADAYAVRELPSSYQPGGQVQVSLSLRVNPDDTPTSVTISETLPAGLTVADAGGGTPIGGSLNWNFSGEEVETKVVSYTLDVADTVSGALDFPGTVSFPGTTEGIKGDRVVYEVPSAPQNLDVEMLLAGHLSWTPSPQQGVVGYRVYSSVNGQAWQEIAYVGANSYTDDSVVPGSTYKYRVSAVNVGGVEGPASSPSDEKMVTMQVREAEDFNYGGGLYPGHQDCPAAVEATADDDLAAGNDYFFQSTTYPDKPNVYRPNDDIDCRESAPGEFIMGYTTVGDWWRYTLEVPSPGAGDPEGGWVKIELRVASPNGGTVELYWDEALVGSVSFVTGSWGMYDCFPMEEQFQTDPGVHALRAYFASGELDFDTIGIGFNWTPPKRQPIFQDDFEDYTTLYVPDDPVAVGWTVENGSGDPDARWRLWNTDSATTNWLANEDPNIAGMTNNYMITDSDLAPNAAMDEKLITPELDCSNWIKLRLDFSKNFRVYPDDMTHLQVGDVDIRTYDEATSSWGGWVNLLRFNTTNVPDMDSSPEQVNLSAYDEKKLQIRWHFHQATYDYWFAVDNIVLTGEMKEIPGGEVRLIALAVGKVELTWSAFGGGNYTVEYTDNLASGDWQPVPGVSWPITETTWPGEEIATVPTRYYRVRSE